MRAVVTAMFGLAAAALVMATVSPSSPNGASISYDGKAFSLVGDAGIDAQYGCLCHSSLANGSYVYDRPLTETCCPAPSRHDDYQLCTPLEIGATFEFLGCCINTGGGHGYGGLCEDTRDIAASNGHPPPNATTTVTSGPATPTGSLNTLEAEQATVVPRTLDFDLISCTKSDGSYNRAATNHCCWAATTNGVLMHPGCLVVYNDTIPLFTKCCGGPENTESKPFHPTTSDEAIESRDLVLAPSSTNDDNRMVCGCDGPLYACCKATFGEFYGDRCEFENDPEDVSIFKQCCYENNWCVPASEYNGGGAVPGPTASSTTYYNTHHTATV